MDISVVKGQCFKLSCFCLILILSRKFNQTTLYYIMHISVCFFFPNYLGLTLWKDYQLEKTNKLLMSAFLILILIILN